jgi:hypothetical protein
MLANVVPINPSARMLGGLLSKHAVMSAGDYAICLSNGLAWFLIGYLVLDRAVNAARRRGLVSGY